MEKYKVMENSVGDIIYKRRKDMKLSQKELAKQIKVPHTHISKLENGHRITMNTFMLLCNALQIELQAVFIEGGFVKSIVSPRHISND